ncbi:hypothetical protein ZIOFF_049641 [Zingiber officinale]|uniref:Pentatricopeptide repeat-containing protein n=1 Tax=Zingiber officinale TaxID=94328 RepID=A0A8J5FJ05_ZINOF|nr:hypothetical protein ZIOFF_049641 [Zingiber officinale]
MWTSPTINAFQETRHWRHRQGLDAVPESEAVDLAAEAAYANTGISGKDGREGDDAGVAADIGEDEEGTVELSGVGVEVNELGVEAVVVFFAVIYPRADRLLGSETGCLKVLCSAKQQLSEDCYRYGGENHATDAILAKAGGLYGGAIRNVEKELEDFSSFLTSQANIAICLDLLGMNREFEISIRQLQVTESPSPENTSKLQASQAKMLEIKESMAMLGKEAAAESQQQRQTFQRIVDMIEAEKSLHLRVAAILDVLEAEIVTEKQQKVSAPPPLLSHNRSEKPYTFSLRLCCHTKAALRMEHYVCGVDLFGRAGQFEEAMKLVESMPFEHDKMAWLTLLGVCRVRSDSKLSSRVAEHLLVLESKHHSTYVLLSHMYSGVGMWDDRATMQITMRSSGLSKVPGWSWVEIRNQVQ